MARIFITGGTGFVGSSLMPHLAARGHDLVLLTRDERAVSQLPPRATLVVGDPLKPGPWWDEVKGCDMAVNLAGAPVMGRWSTAYRTTILESRIKTTQNLVEAIPEGVAFTLFSASGIGIYGDSGEAELTEEAPTGTDFLAGVAARWEEEAQKAAKKGARVVVGRMAYVLGREGGLVQELFRNAKSYLGGRVGGGKQWVSWIHMEDLVDAMTSLLESADASGVYNLAAPEAVRQADIAKTVRSLLKTRVYPPLPAFLVRRVLGQVAETIFFSQRVVPVRLLKRGFVHRHPELRENLRTLL